jgi:hypothetical protein
VELRQGRIPAIDPTRNLGQPFRGNPSTLALYPGNVLYLVLPFWNAFNLHFALHWVASFLGFRALARALGQSAPAALLAATAWAGSGYLVSLLSFYNLIAVAAWAPWLLVGVLRGGRGGLALGGLAWGLVLLAGEPVSAALLLPATVLAAAHDRPLGRALPWLLAVLGAGALVALPQIVATARVASFTFRTAHGVAPADAVLQSLHPARLLELLLPLPWGWPSELGPRGFWAQAVTPNVPFVYSLHLGIVAATLALFALAARWRWALFSAGALVLAWAAGFAPRLVGAATLGLFRYPQKLVLLFTLGAALLAGWGLDRALASERTARRVGRALVGAGAALAAVALGLHVARAGLVELFRSRLALGGNEDLARAAAANWTVGSATGAAALLVAGWAVARRRPALVVLVQGASLLALAPAVARDATAPYREPPPLARHLARGDAIVSLPALRPGWGAEPPYRLGAAGMVGAARLAHANLEPGAGLPLGLRYSFAADAEGLVSPLTVFLLRNLARADWQTRIGWFRRSGTRWVVRPAGVPVAGLEPVDVARHAGVPVVLERVADPGPPVRWPRALESAGSPIDAYRRIAGGRLEEGIAVASREMMHRPGARLRLVEEGPDALVVEVDSGGGLLVVARAFQPIYSARSGGRELPTLPVDVALLGVELPSGTHRVEIAVSSWPEAVASVLALATAIGLAALWAGERRRARTARAVRDR